MKARLQYAQMKMETGLSTENLQKVESAFISSPKQPRRPLPSEYPPYPTPLSRRYRRMLLSATSAQKKKHLQKEEAKRDEAAFTILMLKSQGSNLSQEKEEF
ncbi:hypothetical protein A0J61_09806 [Choanephora cucurbitarum]|uniref:Uncharacterized protein n=1 Tax=Choanephora cucurbitarum TaxID=101091 RepID=A0A1C7N0F1_9FUNG|nr:hypothetical protein A0J61_09806 [Choanephora cucurbitarum]